MDYAIFQYMPTSKYSVACAQEGKAAKILCKYRAYPRLCFLTIPPYLKSFPHLDANGSDERDPLVLFEIAQIRHALRMEEEINKTTSYLSLFQTPGNRKRMTVILGIALCSQWSGNGLVSYYINIVLEGVGVTATDTKAALNGGLQVGDSLLLMPTFIL